MSFHLFLERENSELSEQKFQQNPKNQTKFQMPSEGHGPSSSF